MVHLFTRVTRLISRVANSAKIITEVDSPISLALSSPEHTFDMAMMPTALDPVRSSADPLLTKARMLNDDVDAWIESVQLTTLEHERVQVGNRAYAYAMKVRTFDRGVQRAVSSQILLLRRVFQYPREDGRVQNAALEVLKHCSTSTALLGMSIEWVLFRP